VPHALHDAGFVARVFLGTLLGSTSPAASHSPLVGAEMTIDPGRVVEVPVDAAFEHGILVDSGAVTVDGAAVAQGSLGYVPIGRESIELRAAHDGPARALIVGGTPLGERIVMWWNFVGRTHDDIVQYRADWQAEIGGGPRHFGMPIGEQSSPLPAPVVPNLRLKARG
jgi:redox-sensitive bicupin YhaK (pirin superfamily)